MNLAENEIALWLQPVEEVQHGAEQIFDEKELQRYNRIVNSAKKREFFCSRLLLKKIVVHYLPKQAKAISTTTDNFGRPFWYFERKRLPLYFSLSHTKGMIACAVARTQEIGCDIECIRPRRYEDSLATKVLGEKEMQLYKAQPDAAAANSFFHKCWTLKEAYLKAKGTGIRQSLTALDFGSEVEERERGSTINRETGKWQFYHTILDGRYSLAIAAQRYKDTTYKLYTHRPQGDGCIFTR